MLNLIMLDLDGTLLDTDRLYFEGIPPIVFKHLNKKVAKEDLLPFWGQLARDFFVHFMEQAGVPDAMLIDKMYSEFEQYYIREHKNLAYTHEYVAEYLPELKKMGCPVGIVTTRPAIRAKLVNELPWSRTIDFVVTADHVVNRKPAPDSLDLAIAKYAPDHERASVYLGDNSLDIKAAKTSRYKVISAAALWGSSKPDELLKANPDHVFYTFKEFSNWIKGKG